MCGLIGVVSSKSVQSNSLQEGLVLLSKRGPDSMGTKSGPHWQIGATRLAMTDPLPRSNQPMESETSIIVFNGEIYNYRKLQSNLFQNVGFETDSDTEVLLRLIDSFGIKAVDKLNGMFAFVVLNKSNNSLIISRDSLGKKPLFYMIEQTEFHFASLIDCLKLPSSRLQISNTFLFSYLKLGYGIDPLTPYKEIKSVRPGTAIDVRMGTKTEINQFVLKEYALGSNNKKRSRNNVSPKEIRQLVIDSVASRVRGHSEVGLSLSGGVDSGVLAICLSLLGQKTVAFSAHWPNSDKSRYNDDFNLAEMNADCLGIPFVPIEVFPPNELSGYLDSYLRIMQEPNNNATGLSMLKLYEGVSNHGIRLVLTGDGSDEIFAGYARHQIFQKYAKYVGFLPSNLIDALPINDSLKNRLDKLRIRSFESWSRWHEIFDSNEMDTFFNTPHDAAREADSLFKEIVEASLREFPKGCLRTFMDLDRKFWLTMESNRRLDRVSMAFSIEARSPFQDDNLVSYLNSSRWASRNFVGKSMLISAFPELKSLKLQPKKSGFISPIGHWMRCNELMVQESLSILEAKKILIKGFNSRVSDYLNSGDFRKLQQIWSLFVLSRWLQINELGFN